MDFHWFYINIMIMLYAANSVTLHCTCTGIMYYAWVLSWKLGDTAYESTAWHLYCTRIAQAQAGGFILCTQGGAGVGVCIGRGVQESTVLINTHAVQCLYSRTNSFHAIRLQHGSQEAVAPMFSWSFPCLLTCGCEDEEFYSEKISKQKESCGLYTCLQIDYRRE